MPFHAYGPSVDDNALLDALRQGDDRPQGPDEPFWRAPYSFMWSALYCGGRLTPATVDGVRYLVRTIAEPGFGGDDPTLRHAALWFLRDVADAPLAGVDRAAASRRDEPEVPQWLAAYLREPRSVLEWTQADAPGEVLLAAARTDCFDLLPEVFAAVEPLLAAPAPSLRIHAASAAAMLSRHPDLVAHRPRLLAYHLAECASDVAHHRASMLLGVGEPDGAPRQWLRDPHPGVRVCAALAPALADDPEATAVLLAEATANPAVIDMQAFEGMMALTALPHAAAVLAERLCRGISDIDRLLPAASAAVPYGATYLDVGEEHRAQAALCEPYLRAASRMACHRSQRPRPRSANSPRRSPDTIPPGSVISGRCHPGTATSHRQAPRPGTGRFRGFACSMTAPRGGPWPAWPESRRSAAGVRRGSGRTTRLRSRAR